jgi:hypothetical protein
MDEHIKYDRSNASKALKYSLIIGVLIISFSVFYYLVIFLPQKNNNQRRQALQVRRAEQEKQNLAMQQKCTLAGEKLYAEDKRKWDMPGISLTSSPTYYYNRKLNTCLYSRRVNFANISDAPNLPYDIVVKDSLTNEQLLYFVQNAYEDQAVANKRRIKFDKEYKILFNN